MHIVLLFCEMDDFFSRLKNIRHNAVLPVGYLPCFCQTQNTDCGENMKTPR